MIQRKPIHCHKCGTVVVENADTLTHCVIPPPGLSCPGCGVLVVSVNVVTY